MTSIKKQYELEGLCCGKCAAKIQQEVSGLDGVMSANVDFTSKLLTVELADGTAPEEIAKQAGKIAREIDDDIELKERA